jgi:hypothetical protein
MNISSTEELSSTVKALETEGIRLSWQGLLALESEFFTAIQGDLDQGLLDRSERELRALVRLARDTHPDCKLKQIRMIREAGWCSLACAKLLVEAY